jgi:hypothetical protein
MKDDLREEWLVFELEEFPQGCLGLPVGDQTWEQADAVAAGCISTWLAEGKLDADCRALLTDAVVKLAEMAATADEDCREYFVRLLDLARRTQAAASGG